MKGSVVILPFPFSDLSGVKRRPALVIADRGGEDVMICQITSRQRRDQHVVELSAQDFDNGGLPVQSNIRPNKVFTADRSTILAVVGKVSTIKYSEVVTTMIALIS